MAEDEQRENSGERDKQTKEIADDRSQGGDGEHCEHSEHESDKAAYLNGETDNPAPASAADGELEELLTALREREDMRMLFSLARDASPEDVRQAVKIIEALRRND